MFLQKMELFSPQSFTFVFIVVAVVISHSESVYICNIKCDSTSEILREPRMASNTMLRDWNLVLYISDIDNMAFGSITNANTTMDIWLERSFDGGFLNYEGMLGKTTLNETKAFNIDYPSENKLGSVRICGSNPDSTLPFCTPWARSKVNADTPIDAAATALMQFFSENGTFQTTGWWNSANAIVSVMNYIKLTKKTTYKYAIERLYEKNKKHNFTNKYVDDTLWYGLAWIEAYELLGDEKYLHMAEFDLNYAMKYVDKVCKGGVWWTTEKTYKNAVTNELLIKLAASVHNKIPGDEIYLELAKEVWTWFKSSGMINGKNLINDGLTENCQNNEGIMWTYNQGVILGALVQLNKATGDKQYLEEAKNIADAVLRSTELNPGGILQDYGCEADGLKCDPDQSSFKGIFIRNLNELDHVLANRPYKHWIQTQAETIYHKNRNSLDQYGIHWKGPFDKADAARQHSALDVLNAAYV